VPRSATAPTMAAAMKPAMMAYSTLVAPSSARRCPLHEPIVVSPLIDARSGRFVPWPERVVPRTAVTVEPHRPHR
jgi:hypothetical protein